MSHNFECSCFADKQKDGSWSVQYRIAYVHLDALQAVPIVATLDSYNMYVDRKGTADGHQDITATLTKQCHDSDELVALHRAMVHCQSDLTLVPFQVVTGYMKQFSLHSKKG